MPDTEPSAVNLDNEALSTSPAPPSSKRSKKKAKKLRQQVDDADDTPYAKSVTPSPPTYVSDWTAKEPAVQEPDDLLLASETPDVKPRRTTEDAHPYLVDVDAGTMQTGSVPADVRPAEAIVAPRAQARDLPTRVQPTADSVTQAQPRARSSIDIPQPQSLPYRSTSETPSEDEYDRRRWSARTRLSGAFSPPDHFLPSSPPRRLDIGRRQSSSRYQPPRKSSLFDAPPPHLPQAHFYPPPPEIPRTVRFDTFADAGDHAAAVRASDVLLVGMDGALDVYRLLPDKMEIIARLEGLQGMVLDAKILPVAGSDDPLTTKRPLVALVVSDNVEVYSLRTQEHIRTLYKSLPGMEPQLKLDASGAFFTVSSGTSGEIFVYRDFECIGKFWTMLSDLPLLALGRRWLAIVCQDASMVSIGGDVPLSTNAYGISSHAPLQPAVTTVAQLDHEGLVSRMTRQAAREVRKGVELGLAGWSEFVQPTPRHVESEFPPTHAAEVVKRIEPAVVSIIDLERMNHIATFALEDGCNFLSLSTDGLKLVTTNRTGEATDIWDLTNLQEIRCVQRITRNSPSTVVTAAWSLSDDCLALQTARTVHLHVVSEKAKAKTVSPGTSPGWRFKPGSLADARAVGGRMLVKGLANGYGFAKAGLQEAWHADDNKIRLDGVSHRWLRYGLAVATSEKVCLYPVSRDEKIRVEKGVKQFALPGNGATDCPPEPHGFWTLRSTTKVATAVPEDEYETNPSYCPFHIDKRVALLAYEPRDLECFGESIGPVVTVNRD